MERRTRQLESVGREDLAPPLGPEDPRGRDPSTVSFLRVTPAEVRAPGAEEGVGKAAGPPGWEKGCVRTYQSVSPSRVSNPAIK